MKSKLGLASILFIGATLILKVSGLIRDMVIAYYFGASYVADAYLAAFIIPNMLILFMQNGMKNALVPSYIQAAEEQRGRSHLGQVFKGTAGLALILSIIGMAIAPVLIPLLYPDFSPEASQIAIWVTVIFFACISFVGMNSVLEAFFDAENKFSLSIVSQIIVILSSIAGAFLFANQIGAYSLAIGYAVGTVLSLIFKAFIVVPQRSLTLKEKFDWAGSAPVLLDLPSGRADGYGRSGEPACRFGLRQLSGRGGGHVYQHGEELRAHAAGDFRRDDCDDHLPVIV